MSKFQVGDRVRLVNTTVLNGKEGLVVDAGRDAYRVQVPGWGTLMYLGEDLEKVEPITPEQAWDRGARYGFEEYRGKLDATIENVLTGNPYRGQSNG